MSCSTKPNSFAVAATSNRAGKFLATHVATVICFSSSVILAAVPIVGERAGLLPKPYVRWNVEKAILVAANPTNKPVQVQATFSPAVCGWPSKPVTVTDIWSTSVRSAETIAANSDGVVSIPLALAPDHTPGGGVGVWLIEFESK